MNSKNNALINYYVRLIQKQSRTIEDVPTDIRADVEKILAESKPVKVKKTAKPK